MPLFHKRSVKAWSNKTKGFPS